MRRSLLLTTCVAALALATIGAIGLGPRAARPTSPLQQPACADGGPARAAAAVASQRQAVAAPPPRTLTGRCVDWHSLAAVPGCRIATDDGARAVSDSDGDFELLVASEAAAVDIEVTAQDRLTTMRRVDAGSAASAISELRLRPGTQVAGTLRDEHGQPCRDQAIHLRIANRPSRDDGWIERYATQTHTALDGSFRFPQPLPVGLVEVTVAGPTPLSGTTSFVLEQGSRDLQLTCRAWQAEDVISGSVRDRRGLGVARALVQAFTSPEADHAPIAWAQGDADGRFQLIRRDAATGPAWLTAMAARPGGRAPALQPTPWGSTEVTIELPAGDGVSLHVVDARSGAPIERYAVQCVATAGVRFADSGTRRNDGFHEGGWSWLDDLAPGPHELIVWPGDPSWLANLPQAFDVERSGGIVRVALQPAVPCPTRVVTDDGRSLCDIEVELMVPVPGTLERDHDQLLADGGTGGPIGVRVARAVTDDDGVASLRWFEDPQPLELRLHGPGMAPHVQRDVQIAKSGLTVRVPAAGLLRTRLHGAGGARLALQEVDGPRRLPLAWSEPLQLDGDGNLSATVPTGSWQVTLWTRTDSAPVWAPAPTAFATITIEADQSTQLDADLSAAMTTGQCTGTAFVDGAPAGHLVLLCGADVGDGDMRVLHAIDGHTDERGSFRFAGLRAGHYALQLRLPCADRKIAVPVVDWHQLAPDERYAPPLIAVTTAPVRVTLHDADDRAVVRGQLTLRSESGIAVVGTPDGRGEVAFDRLPIGRYRLQLRAEQTVVDLGWLDVVGGGPSVRPFLVR